MHEMCESWPNYPNDTFAGARFFISCLGVGSPAMVIEAKVASFQGGSFPVLILPPESHKVPFSQLPANNGWQPGCGPTDQINQWGVTQRPEKKKKKDVATLIKLKSRQCTRILISRAVLS